MFNAAFFREVERLQEANVPFCAVTVVDGRGSIPQEVGAKAIFSSEGLVFGTVGGGAVEVRCQELALELLEGNDAARNRFERWNLQTDIGMTCGGEMALYFEVHHPELDWQIVVFGAGHVAQKLCRFLAELDCHVLCVDTRPEWLDRLPESPRLETWRVAEYTDGVARIGPGASVLLMTSGHGSDLPILVAMAKAGLDPPFIGVIGSDSKARVLRRELAEAGVAKTFIERIHCPVGDTDVGDNTPPEIAISIVSQLLKMR
jgi:xanthine dehydrogenase accessory factor